MIIPDQTNAYNNGYEAGAKAERDRIIERLKDVWDCIHGKCIDLDKDCPTCWREFLGEAGE